MPPAAASARAGPRSAAASSGSGKQQQQGLTSFFAALPDDAFFRSGPASPVQHLYLYGEVTRASLRKLRADVDAASKGVQTDAGATVAPRPIVLHVNSPGGSAAAGLSMTSVFIESRVPICVCVDGLSASAATLVSILAPYRVMAPLATCLVHDYSSFGYGKREDHVFEVETGASLTAAIKGIYLRRTRMPKDVLDELMARDLLLDAPRCLSLGICDRVLATGGGGGKRAATSRPTPTPTPTPTTLPLQVVLRKTNLNHIRFDCEAAEDFALGAAQRLDQMLGSGDGLRPVVLHADGLACLGSISEQVATLTQRVAALGRMTETYGIIDTTVSLLNVLPLLVCRRRVMYAHAHIEVHLVYEKEFGWMLRDALANTQLMLDTVRSLLREHTRLPADLVGAIDRRRFLLSAADCLRHGVVDEVLEL